MRMLTRIKKAEEAINSREKPFRFVFMDAGETEEHCLKRNDFDPEEDGLTVFIVKWAEGFPDMPFRTENSPAPPTVDEEIEQLLVDLQQQGLSQEDIEKMVDGSAEPQKDEAMI